MRITRKCIGARPCPRSKIILKRFWAIFEIMKMLEFWCLRFLRFWGAGGLPGACWWFPGAPGRLWKFCLVLLFLFFCHKVIWGIFWPYFDTILLYSHILKALAPPYFENFGHGRPLHYEGFPAHSAPPITKVDENARKKKQKIQKIQKKDHYPVLI